MKEDFYFHQRFLLDTQYTEIHLADYRVNDVPGFLQDIHESVNLFDYGCSIERKVYLSFLFTEIDDYSDWLLFLNQIDFVETIYIEEDFEYAKDNVIIRDFYESNLKAIIYRLLEKGMKVWCFQKQRAR